MASQKQTKGEDRAKQLVRELMGIRGKFKIEEYDARLERLIDRWKREHGIAWVTEDMIDMRDGWLLLFDPGKNRWIAKWAPTGLVTANVVNDETGEVSEKTFDLVGDIRTGRIGTRDLPGTPEREGTRPESQGGD